MPVGNVDILSGVIAGEGRVPADQFGVASVIQNRANINYGHLGDVFGQAFSHSQFEAFPNALGTRTPYTDELANALQGGTLSSYGDTGNALYYNAPGYNPNYAAGVGNNYGPGTNQYSDVFNQPPSQNFQLPQAGSGFGQFDPNAISAGNTAAGVEGMTNVNASDQGVGSIGGGLFGNPAVSTYGGQSGIYGYGVGPQGNNPYGVGGIGEPTYATDSNIAGPNSVVGSDTADSQGQYASSNFSTVNPGDPGFNPNWNSGNSYTNPLVVTMDPGSAAGDAGGAFGGASAGAGQIQAGPGMPVKDQGLANAASKAGTDISQAISNPLSQSVTKAGGEVQSGVTSAAQQVSQTASGILAGAEKYFGTTFVYIIVAVLGVVFVAVGLAKFGGPKIRLAKA